MSLSFVADENFDGKLLGGLLNGVPGLDVVRVQDAGLAGAADPEILEWAAQQGRVLLTQDVSTMTKFALERLRSGRPLPGVIAVHQSAPRARTIGDLVVLVGAGIAEDFAGQIHYVPI